MTLYRIDNGFKAMANNADDNSHAVTTEQAMNRVLQAEHDARGAVDQCKQQADAMIQQARLTAQKIAEKADHRITRIHQRCSREVTDQVTQLKRDQEQQAKDSHSYEVDVETVDVVVEQIAELLTTPEDESQN
jgi:vacuolar-type H+-ATPase subunit H